MAELPTTTVASTITASSTNDYSQLQDSNDAPRRSRKSSSAHKRKRKTVVFATGSQYNWLFGLIVATPLLTIILWVILFDAENDYKNSTTIWALGWSFVFLVVLYMAILPRKVDVRSNGTVAIKTCLLTFFIDDISRAIQCDNISGSDLWRPTLLLATSWNKKGAVLLRRRHGKWDVVVSPVDPFDFCEALEGMLLKDTSDGDFVVLGKPSLSEPV